MLYVASARKESEGGRRRCSFRRKIELAASSFSHSQTMLPIFSLSTQSVRPIAKRRTLELSMCSRTERCRGQLSSSSKRETRMTKNCFVLINIRRRSGPIFKMIERERWRWREGRMSFELRASSFEIRKAHLGTFPPSSLQTTSILKSPFQLLLLLKTAPLDSVLLQPRKNLRLRQQRRQSPTQPPLPFLPPRRSTQRRLWTLFSMLRRSQHHA